MTDSRLGPLRRREFRLLFAGRVVSMVGNAIAPVALAFAVLDLTGSKTDLGFVLTARQVPQVVFLLFGGVVADRLPRHVVLVGSSLVSGGTQGTLALLLITHHASLWHLIALSMVNGSSSAFFYPASSGIIPQTVEPEMLQQANATLRLALNATGIGGAAVGGILVAAIGPGWAILIDGVSFALGAVFIGLMNLPPGLRVQGRSVFRELHDGWREFRSRTWLWAIVAQFSILNGAVAGAESVLGPVVAKTRLGGPAAWGFILTAEAAGLVVAGLTLLRFKPQRILLVATFAVFGLALPLIGLGVPFSTPVIAGLAFVAGFCFELFGVLWDTAMQQEIPHEKLSRVSSYDALGSFVLVPIGLAAAGPIAVLLGTRAALFDAAGLIVASTLAVLLVRDVRTVRRRT